MLREGSLKTSYSDGRNSTFLLQQRNASKKPLFQMS